LWYRLVYDGDYFKYARTTDIYTLSLHDALPISVLWIFPMPVQPYGCRLISSTLISTPVQKVPRNKPMPAWTFPFHRINKFNSARSEEHTSELQSRENLVCRLLLEKKKDHTIQKQ